MLRTTCALIVIGLLLVSGCGRSTESDSTINQKKSSAKAPQPPGPSSTASSDNGASRSGQDMPGASAPKSGSETKTYAYQKLVEAVGNPMMLTAYRRYESGLEADPGNTELMMQKASLLFSAGTTFMNRQDRPHSLDAFEGAFKQAKSAVGMMPNAPGRYRDLLSQIYYNGACCQALQGNAEAASQTLHQAIQWGWSDLDGIKSDTDLASLRALPGFDATFKKWSEEVRQVMLDRGREELANGTSFPFDFAVTDIDGAEHKLADFKGKVLIVDIWGTWCPPCRAEIPSFIKLQDKYGPSGLQIIGLNYERVQGDAALSTVRDFVKAQGMNYPCALGTPEIRSQVPQFRGYPTTLFIDRTGAVRLMLVGSHPYAFLESVVAVLLAEE